MPNTNETEGQIDYGLWIWRVISWDTLVPASLLLVPITIAEIFPRMEVALALAAALLPGVAFAIRFFAGRRQIASNWCTQRVRSRQIAALVLGILPLMFVDCSIILAHGPPGAPQPLPVMPPAEVLWLLLAGCVAFYLGMMAIAMYPGRTVPETGSRYFPNR
ncbi:MAG TPA: hypothetical protein VGG30_01165 [Pirellulales bacterium]